MNLTSGAFLEAWSVRLKIYDVKKDGKKFRSEYIMSYFWLMKILMKQFFLIYLFMICWIIMMRLILFSQLISQLMVYMISTVSMVFCGHMGRTELAGVSLAAAVRRRTWGVRQLFSVAAFCKSSFGFWTHAFKWMYLFICRWLTSVVFLLALVYQQLVIPWYLRLGPMFFKQLNKEIVVSSLFSWTVTLSCDQ